MKEELLKLLYNYSVNGIIADKYYIEKFIKIVNHYKKLDNYLDSFELNYSLEEKKNIISAYSFCMKRIIVYFNKLQYAIKNNNTSKYLIPKNEDIFLKNVMISQMLLHELEHANQAKIMDEHNNIESQILRLTGVGKSTEYVAIKLQKKGYNLNKIKELINNKILIYNKYYDFAPHERLSEIKSYETLYSITSMIKDIVPNVNKIQEIGALNNMLKGFTLNKELISPTILYLKMQGEEKELEKFNWYDSSLTESIKKAKRYYSLEDRIRLGLPIDEIEHYQVKKRLNRLVLSL